MLNTKRLLADRSKLSAVENPPGIRRTTLSFNEDVMLCHFLMKKGASIPVHKHEAVQIGYVTKGCVRFVDASGEKFVAVPGMSYTFEKNEYHGAEVLEDSEVIEVFSPMRPEYADN